MRQLPCRKHRNKPCAPSEHLTERPGRVSGYPGDMIGRVCVVCGFKFIGLIRSFCMPHSCYIMYWLVRSSLVVTLHLATFSNPFENLTFLRRKGLQRLRGGGSAVAEEGPQRLRGGGQPLPNFGVLPPQKHVKKQSEVHLEVTRLERHAIFRRSISLDDVDCFDTFLRP